MRVFFGGLCPFIAGAMFLLIGGTMARRTVRILRHGVRARALVVAEQWDEGGRFVTVEFRDAAGATRQSTLSTSDRTPVGQSVAIIYHASAPTLVQVVSGLERWVFPAVVLACGLMGLAMAVLAWAGVLGSP